MERYPDILEYSYQQQSTQDENGHYVEKEATWLTLGACRLERDVNGAGVRDNANVRDHNFTVYMPKTTLPAKMGERIRVTVRRDGRTVETIEANVLAAGYGYKNNRLWAK